MILQKLAVFLGLVGFMLGIDQVSYTPPPTPEASRIQLSGQLRFRRDGTHVNRTPRYELVLSETYQARLYFNGTDRTASEISWVQSLGEWRRTADTLHVFDCQLLVASGHLIDEHRCLVSEVRVWRGSRIEGW